MDYQQRITVGGASCACVSQRDSIGLHNEGGRMGEFSLLYLLCMLPFPVPLTSLQCLCMPESLLERCYIIAKKMASSHEQACFSLYEGTSLV
jgi:hypothetical protein